jgi:hypothetical protein
VEEMRITNSHIIVDTPDNGVTFVIARLTEAELSQIALETSNQALKHMIYRLLMTIAREKT